MPHTLRFAMIISPAPSLPTSLEELLGRSLAAKLDRLDLLSRKIFAGKLPGERRSKRRGRSVEFDDYRNYVAGDDLRHVDWNILARFDRFVVKLFREEEDLSLHLLVDASPSMNAGTPNKLVFAHQLAMALSYIGVVNQNRVSLGVFGVPNQPLKRLAPIRGRPAVARIADLLLTTLKAASDTPAAPAPAELASAMRSVAASASGRGVLVVISDFLAPEGLAPGLNALASLSGAGYDVYCLQTLAPSELDPTKQEPRLLGDLRLTDVESGRATEVSISPRVIARYRAAVSRYTDQLRADCRSRGLAHLLVPTDTPVESLVISSFRKSGMLR